MGREATAEAFAYAWEHWNRICRMENPSGYVFRVGQRIGKRMTTRIPAVGFSASDSEMPLVEPKLAPALETLTGRQRTVIVLVHALGWTHQETATFLGLSTSTVQKHAERAVDKLRQALGVDSEY